MESYKYELDMDYKPGQMKGRMTGIAKSVAGIYAFNKLRKVSKAAREESEHQPEETTEQETQMIKEYVFYESGINLVSDMLDELFDRYIEYCDAPDQDVIDRATYVRSLINYAKGEEATDATEA
jgi:hypothetical protein